MTSKNTTAERPPGVTATAMLDDASPMDFDLAVERLRTANTFVLSTIRSDGRPHAVPLFAVWADGALHFAAAESTQKARDLVGNSACVLNAKSNGSDLVVEGHARRVTDDEAVRRVAAAYGDKYDWDPEPDGAELHAPGAPTAGAPPFSVYRVDAHTAFAFPNETEHAPTRWSFEPRQSEETS